MNNLKKFATEAEYTAATLSYPAVSWVVSGDTVHYDKTSGSPTPTVNDKVMMAWHSPSNGPSGKDIVIWHTDSTEPTSLFDSLTINDIDLMSTIGAEGVLYNYSTPDTDYLVKYDLINDTTITDIFAGDLGGGWGSSADNVDFLVPSQVTEIQSLPNNVGNLVVEAATPPTTSINWSSITPTVYVPDNAVSAYETVWSEIGIFPISEYQGNLPV